jgi:hypothetical protein
MAPGDGALPAEEARNYRPSVVILGEGNEVERIT